MAWGSSFAACVPGWWMAANLIPRADREHPRGWTSVQGEMNPAAERVRGRGVAPQHMCRSVRSCPEVEGEWVHRRKGQRGASKAEVVFRHPDTACRQHNSEAAIGCRRRGHHTEGQPAAGTRCNSRCALAAACRARAASAMGLDPSAVVRQTPHPQSDIGHHCGHGPQRRTSSSDG